MNDLDYDRLKNPDLVKATSVLWVLAPGSVLEYRAHDASDRWAHNGGWVAKPATKIRESIQFYFNSESRLRVLSSYDEDYSEVPHYAQNIFRIARVLLDEKHKREMDKRAKREESEQRDLFDTLTNYLSSK